MKVYTMMEGLQLFEEVKEPLRKLPQDWTNKKICLKFVGGVGDVVVGIGSVSISLKKKPCKIIASTLPFQKKFILSMSGVDDWINPQKLHRPEIYSNFDVIIDFAGAFNNAKELKSNDYYKLVEEKIGIKVSLPKLKFIAHSKSLNNRPSIALHPGASNPNRRWFNDKWTDLAYALVERGFYVCWLGTKDEFGFNDVNIKKLSDVDEDLLWQARHLSKCSYFIGTDSSFAHIAGILGIKGVVLFGNTSPKHVIVRYTSLKGIEGFKKLNVNPTRKLDRRCLISITSMRAINVEDILKTLNFDTLEIHSTIRNPISSKRWKVGINIITENGKKLKKVLSEYCDVFDEDVSAEDFFDKGYDIGVMESEKECVVKTLKQSVRVRSIDNPENVRRAIREVFLRSED